MCQPHLCYITLVSKESVQYDVYVMLTVKSCDDLILDVTSQMTIKSHNKLSIYIEDILFLFCIDSQSKSTLFCHIVDHVRLAWRLNKEGG